jgi:transglutaminase-like putative cysteine protease
VRIELSASDTGDYLAPDPGDYLAPDPVLDFDNPAVATLAQPLRRDHPGEAAFAAAAFEYVRDQVGHSLDVQDQSG